MTEGLAVPGRAQNTANTFQNNLTEAIAGRKNAGPNSAASAAEPKSATAIVRQGIGAARRNFAASSPAAEIAGTRVPSSVRAVMSAKNLDTTAASASSQPVTNPLAAAAKANAVTTSPAPALTSDQIVAGLLQQNAVPSPYAPTSTPSTDPGTYMGGNYIKQSNLNFIVQGVNHENQNRFDEYQNGLQNWAQGGMKGDPPAPPKYEVVDATGFENWWSQYTANIGYQNAAPISTFVTNTTA
jgi:hypothetical protein